VGSRVTARLLLASAWLVAWTGTAVELVSARTLGNPQGIARWLPADVLVGPAPTALMGLLGVVGCVLLVRSRRPLGPALLLFAVLYVQAQVEVSLYMGTARIGHGKFLPGVAMGVAALGWGSTWLGRSREEAERLALELACGVAAALYFSAGMVKLWTSGLHWAQNLNLSLLVYERSFLVDGTWRAVRVHLAEAPTLLSGLGALALTVELASVLFLFPRLRFAYACLVTAMHLGLGVCLGYWYVEWVLAMWALVVWTAAGGEDA